MKTMQSNRLGNLLLEAARYRLGVESVQLIYSVCVNVREVRLSVGTPIVSSSPMSPYNWIGTCLPRTAYCDTGFLSESVYFGELGSASILTLAHKEAKESLLNDMIIEHCKLHAVLHDSLGERIDDFVLSEKERLALYYGARGLTARETAQEMHINFRSVEYLLKMAKEKLGAQNLPEAVYQAVCTRQLRI